MALHAPLVRAVAEMKHYSLYPLDLVWPDRFSALYRGLFHRLPGTEVLAGTGYSPFLGFVPLVGLLIFAGSVRRLRWTWAPPAGRGRGAGGRAFGLDRRSGKYPCPTPGSWRWCRCSRRLARPFACWLVVLLAAGLITGAAWDRLRLRATTPRRPGFWILVGVALLIVAEHLHAPFVLEAVWVRQPFVRLGQEARSRTGRRVEPRDRHDQPGSPGSDPARPAPGSGQHPAGRTPAPRACARASSRALFLDQPPAGRGSFSPTTRNSARPWRRCSPSSVYATSRCSARGPISCPR